MLGNFDSAAAGRFIEQDDRDEAWFFAGREAESGAFAAAARQAYGLSSDGGRPRAVFRIFQGAPGCGKTSFVRRMEAARPDLLFVLVDEQHLTDANALMQRIAQEALDQRRGANILSGLAVVALEPSAWGARGVRPSHEKASRMKTASEALLRGAGDRAAKQAGLVIWLDEAQTVDESCRALASAHKGALGVPALVVLSGLPTTARCVRSIPGLSRLADAAVIDMGAMTDDECAASTRMMLEAFKTDANDAAVGEAASRVAAMAVGWPQHLTGAQKALAKALMAADGNLEEVDMAAVERDSNARRAAYYGQRLDSGVLVDDPALAVAVIAEIGSGHMDRDLRSMVDSVCVHAQALDSYHQSAEAAKAFLDDMVRHGILVRRRSPADVLLDRWSVAVPSMAAWAEAAGHGAER